MAVLRLPYSHSQVAVFTAGMADPFNDWEQEHVDQGFAWRPGSVSFATLEDGGSLSIEVTACSTWTAASDAIRIIRVPFTVDASGVEVASIIDGRLVDMPPGSYCLYYEAGLSGDPHACRLTFVPDESPTAEIVRADAGLRPPARLRLTASPARP